ncbi:MAG TPA: hypothetical protein VG188_02845 [Solirubrobacteraceae bacterium]|jgi:hypothetical protein|nr:hypothetical protein [Solirubrobacteraceae bacterium]
MSTARGLTRGWRKAPAVEPAAPAATGSIRGGSAGTQAGSAGSASTASAARPGQLQSPELSNQTCARDVFAAVGIQEIQRTLAEKPKPCTNLPKARHPRMPGNDAERNGGRRRRARIDRPAPDL